MVETLAWRYNVPFVVTSDQIIRFAVVLDILIFIILSIVISELVDVIAVPPNVFCRNFILHYAILAVERMVSVHLSITARQRDPVAVAQFSFFHRCRNRPVHLDRHIPSALPNRRQRICNCICRFSAVRCIVPISSWIREIVIRLSVVAERDVLQVYIRTVFNVVPSCLVRFISWIGRSTMLHPVFIVLISVAFSPCHLVEHLSRLRLVAFFQRFGISAVYLSVCKQG